MLQVDALELSSPMTWQFGRLNSFEPSLSMAPSAGCLGWLLQQVDDLEMRLLKVKNFVHSWLKSRGLRKPRSGPGPQETDPSHRSRGLLETWVATSEILDGLGDEVGV